MRILFITHYAALYGANKSLLDIIRIARKHNFHPILVLPENGAIEKILQLENIEYHIIPFEMSVYYRSLSSVVFRPFRAIKKLFTNIFLLKKFRDINPDLIYSNSIATNIGTLISLYLNKPHIQHVREFGEKDYNLTHDLGKRITQYLIGKSKIIICISKSIQETLSAENKKKSIVIFNGVVRNEIIEKYKIKSKKNKQANFAIIGYIQEKKGQHIAILVFKEFLKKNPGSTLYVVGDGDQLYLERLKYLVLENKLDNNVIFTGYIDNIYPFFEVIDATLVCSEFEALGRITLESLACGIPVIGNNSAGTKELLTDNYNGYLYNRSSEDLLEKMLHLASLSDLEYSTLSKNSKLDFETKYSFVEFEINIINTIKGVLKNVD